jgi:hypothetical protein
MNSQKVPKVVIASEAIRRSRCEGKTRGNLKGSLAPLRTRLRCYAPRNDTSLHFLRFQIWETPQSLPTGRQAHPAFRIRH